MLESLDKQSFNLKLSGGMAIRVSVFVPSTTKLVPGFWADIVEVSNLEFDSNGKPIPAQPKILRVAFDLLSESSDNQPQSTEEKHNG